MGQSVLEKLRTKRALDVQSAEALISIGWRQIGPHEGLLWCATCSQPTVWRDATGTPRHLLCSDLAQG